jgi:pimeloyl-ACP methyl ester carboxylesterase
MIFTENEQSINEQSIKERTDQVLVMPPITTVRKFVTVAPGVEIYTERRTLSKTTNPTETILFVHGLGCSINTYYPIFALILSERPESTLLAFDWSGCGLSPHARPTSTIHDLIGDVDKVVELEAPEGPLVVVGHSAGAHLITHWLTSPAIISPHTPRVRSAIFIGGPINVPVSALLMRLVDAVESTRGLLALEDQFLPLLLGPETVESKPLAIALMRGILVGHSKEGFIASVRALAGIDDEGPLLWERLPKALRVLFIGGRDDPSVKPDLIKKFSDKAQGSQVVILDMGQ